MIFLIFMVAQCWIQIRLLDEEDSTTQGILEERISPWTDNRRQSIQVEVVVVCTLEDRATMAPSYSIVVFGDRSCVSCQHWMVCERERQRGKGIFSLCLRLLFSFSSIQRISWYSLYLSPISLLLISWTECCFRNKIQFEKNESVYLDVYGGRTRANLCPTRER